MQCISTVSYSVIINGEAYGYITPSRGLRPGDPLSLGLFLLWAKGFSMLIHQVARHQALNGVSICRGYPSIIHIFFANDSLLFCKANVQECNELMSILGVYESALGQKINPNKSLVFFSPSTLSATRDEILNSLGPMQESRYKKYLGLPSLIGKSKSQVFAKIKERVGKKLAGWKGKLLSIGDREVLIKVVAQVVPTYTMSCFQLPKTLCDNLKRMMRNFWWGQRNQESKIAWVSWKKMCKSKLYGGMAFRNLQAFNPSLTCKTRVADSHKSHLLGCSGLQSKILPL